MVLFKHSLKVAQYYVIEEYWKASTYRMLLILILRLGHSMSGQKLGRIFINSQLFLIKRKDLTKMPVISSTMSERAQNKNIINFIIIIAGILKVHFVYSLLDYLVELIIRFLQIPSSLKK